MKSKKLYIFSGIAIIVTLSICVYYYISSTDLPHERLFQTITLLASLATIIPFLWILVKKISSHKADEGDKVEPIIVINLPEPPEARSSQYKRGVKLYNSEKYSDAVECFENAEKRLKKDSVSYPHDRAKIYRSIGATQSRLNLLDDAINSFLEALHMYTNVMLDVIDEKIQVYKELAGVYALNYDFNKSADTLKDALQVLETANSANKTIQNADILSTLSGILILKGDLKAARDYSYNADEGFTHLLEREKLQAASVKCILAKALLEYGEAKKAIPYIDEALNIRLDLLPDVHWEIGITYSLLGDAYRLIFDYDESHKYYNLAFDIQGRMKCPKVADTCHGLGILYLEHGHLLDSEEMIKRAVVHKEKDMPAGHPEIADCYYSLGKLYLEYGSSRLSDAEVHLKQAKAIQEKVFGKSHYKTALTYLAIGMLACRKSQKGVAEKYINMAEDTLRGTFEANHFVFAEIYESRAEVFLIDDHKDLAISSYFKAEKILLSAIRPKHPRLAKVWEATADVCFGNGDYEDAKRLYLQVKDILEAKQDIHDEHIIKLLRKLGLSYFYLCDYDIADSLLSEAYRKLMALDKGAAKVLCDELIQLFYNSTRSSEFDKWCIIWRNDYGCWHIIDLTNYFNWGEYKLKSKLYQEAKTNFELVRNNSGVYTELRVRANSEIGKIDDILRDIARRKKVGN